LMENAMSKIISEITRDESHMVMNEIKNRFTFENVKLNEEINFLKSDLNEFAEKGEELSQLVKEYKKLCKMIECKKNN
jgi:hypothetical protein